MFECSRDLLQKQGLEGPRSQRERNFSKVSQTFGAISPLEVIAKAEDTVEVRAELLAFLWDWAQKLHFREHQG